MATPVSQTITITAGSPIRWTTNTTIRAKKLLVTPKPIARPFFLPSTSYVLTH